MPLKLIAGLLCLLPLAATAADVSAADAARSLAPGGTLRAAINYGNPVLAQRDPAGGDPHGVSADLARELARRLGLPLRYVPFDQAGKVTDAAASGAWDVAFLAVDPRRAEQIDFTAPYVVIEGAYLVPASSPIHSVGDVDRDGVRVMVERGSAYDLFLQRTLHHAKLVYPPPGTPAAALFLREPVEVLAGVKQPQAALAAANPGVRLVPGRFMEIGQAMGTLHGREAGAAYLRTFIEQAKASGFVSRALAASGQADAEVAPPAK